MIDFRDLKWLAIDRLLSPLACEVAIGLPETTTFLTALLLDDRWNKSG